MIEIRDVNGEPMLVTQDAILEAFVENRLRVLGLDHGALLELRRQYLLRGGQMEITAETVRTTFGRKEV